MADKQVPPSTGRHDIKATYQDKGDGTHALILVGLMYVWNTDTLAWEKYTG